MHTTKKLDDNDPSLTYHRFVRQAFFSAHIHSLLGECMSFVFLMFLNLHNVRRKFIKELTLVIPDLNHSKNKLKRTEIFGFLGFRQNLARPRTEHHPSKVVGEFKSVSSTFLQYLNPEICITRKPSVYKLAVKTTIFSSKQEVFPTLTNLVRNRITDNRSSNKIWSQKEIHMYILHWQGYSSTNFISKKLAKPF